MNKATSAQTQTCIDILKIVSKALDLELAQLPTPDFYIPEIDSPEVVDLEEVKYLLRNPQLLNNEYIYSLVKKNLTQYQLMPAAYFDVENFEDTWDGYRAKLSAIIEQVKYRVANDYFYNDLLPPQKQLWELQQECMRLSGNLSCFYKFFIEICELGHITRYKYSQIRKQQSHDLYISQVDMRQRGELSVQYAHDYYEPFIAQGGQWLFGRSEIDATSFSNIFYYRIAKQLIYLHVIKQYIGQIYSSGAFGDKLCNYGQLPVEQREEIWQLIKKYIPAERLQDYESIFYKFANFSNHVPGAYFTDLPVAYAEGSNPTPQRLHNTVKTAGLRSKKLVLLSRSVVEDWVPKRFLVMSWLRSYALHQTRKGGTREQMRIWPNEMPYCPGHGLSICGDGQLEGLEHYGSMAYEWNVPIDASADIDNTVRDIEKMFRELKLLCPSRKISELLPGEQYLNMFQNTIAYTTQNTQHLHITSGTIDSYPLYTLEGTNPHYVAVLDATLDLVQVGNKTDALFLKVSFRNLDNEALIRFLVQLNAFMFEFFEGIEFVDAYTHLFPTKDGGYVFIYEPHARLKLQDDGLFLNMETMQKYPRRPQFVIPEPENCSEFATQDPLAAGLEYARKFFDATCKHGVYDFMLNYINQYL